MAWPSFVAISILVALFFALHRRRFDLLAISAIGCSFYFSPLLVGHVLLPYGYDPTIPDAVYWIAGGLMLSLVIAALIASRLPELHPSSDKLTLPLSPWYAAAAAIGLVVAVTTTKGAIINPDKVVALHNVGYGYVTFEIGASLACIAGVLERRWTIVALACLFLIIDLLIGFRPYATLTPLAVGYVLLSRQPRMVLLRKAPIYGSALLILGAALFLVHSARFAVFEKLATVTDSAPVATTSAQMRSDTLQFVEATAAAQQGATGKTAAQQGTTKLSSVLPRLGGFLSLFEQSEPFIVQSTLVETIRRGYSCVASNILKSLTLIPGAGHLLPSFPMTFYDEYQPALFPSVTYGMGGNVWAEMMCRFGYYGLVIFGLLYLAALVWLDRLILTSSAALIPPLAFCGMIMAFYIHRNDLHFTLVMMRQVFIVFAMVWLAARCSRLVLSPRQPTAKPVGSA